MPASGKTWSDVFDAMLEELWMKSPQKKKQQKRKMRPGEFG